ncbi:MAG: rhomboid family intramembrane serine protease, partial [Gammaproteobacteria bacterium]
MIPLRDDLPTRGAPILTITFIVACCVIFLWQISLGERGFQVAVYSLGVIPATLLGNETLPPEFFRIPPTLTVFSSMFLHGGWMHLIGNM